MLTNIYWWFHVIIKERHPTTYHPDNVLLEQVPEEHGAMNNWEHVNDHIEEDPHTDNIVDDDGTNILIHDSFNVIMDENDIDNENDDDFDDVHDIPLLDKAYDPLYEGLKKNILSAILFIMNFKVMNGLSNIAITWILRYLK